MPLLSIDIEARYAKFQDAMNKIQASAKKSAGGIEAAFKGVNGTLASLGVGVSVAGLAAIVKTSIDAADHLNDLSQKTGISVEVLGGLGFAASQAGGNLDTMAAAAGKLNKQIAAAAAGNQEAVNAFKTLDINVEAGAGKLKTADAVMLEISDKFKNFADGPNKAALALSYFGKSGADMIPVLNDGAEALRKNVEYFQRYSKVSSDLAEKSDKFNDDLEKIKILSGAAGNQIASELLPTLSQITKRMIDAKESSEGFAGVAKVIGVGFRGITIGANTLIEALDAVGKHIGATFAIARRFADFDFKGGINVGKEYLDDLAERGKKFAEFTAKIANGETADTGPTKQKDNGVDQDAPGIPGAGAAAAQAAAKRRLEGQLRNLEQQSQREWELLSSRNDMLNTFYQQDLIALDAYYTAKQAAANEALANEQANIDKEIALLRKSKPKDDAEREANNTKIKELAERRGQLEAQANAEITKSEIEKTARAKDFARALDDINTRLLEQQGFFEKAAAAGFDAEHANTRTKLDTARTAAVEAGDTAEVEKIDQAQRALDIMRASVVAQGRINELQIAESKILGDLQVATESADMAAESGSISQLEALKRISDARKQAAIDLQATAQAFSDAAAASGDERLEQQAKQFDLAAKKLAASADLVRDKFQGILQNGFGNFFERLISGTVSVKDAFKSLFAEIAADMAKMAIKDLTSKAFGSNGWFGSAVSALAGWFGSANGNVFNAGNVVPFAMGGVPGIVNSPTLFPMRGGRTGLMGEAGPEAIMPLHRDKAGELAIKMIGNRGEAFMLPITRDMAGKLSVRAPDGLMQKFASGGVFSTGSLSPTFSTNAAGALEAAMSTRTGGWMAKTESHETKIENHYNITVPPGTQRESADQIAARTAMHIARSNRRNN